MRLALKWIFSSDKPYQSNERSFHALLAHRLPITIELKAPGEEFPFVRPCQPDGANRLLR